MVAARWLAEGNNTERVAGGVQVSPQSKGKRRSFRSGRENVLSFTQEGNKTGVGAKKLKAQ